MATSTRSLAAIAILGLLGSSANAAFHVMQIEQVIGGVNGNTASQAIQLRLRSPGQNLVSNSKLWAWDAAGLNRVLLLDIASNVSNGATGDHVLLSTASFNNYMVTNGALSYTPDFTLVSAIPSSYLNAGRLTFEDDGGSVATAGTVYWSLSWGGASYTGPTTGDPTNDANSNFGPSLSSALPSLTRGGVIFSGAAAAASTTNLADYALSANPATFTKNNGTSFVIPAPEPSTIALGISALLALAVPAWRKTRRRRLSR